ncbi:MAG: tRNA (adenosine(37)-N6)-threonylcarbamoyltransferase complex ATPase subunit type 1 TsaE [Planctomycetota bacterium]
MSEMMTIDSRSVEETIRIGRAIGGALVGGEVIALVGELGAGKTHLVKGIAAGLGVVDERTVNSPTIVLVNEYAGRVPVIHLDAYRLAGAGQLAALGFEEMCESGGVVIVEWADRVREVIPEGAVWIEMTATGDMSRRIVLNSDSADVQEKIKSWVLDR